MENIIIPSSLQITMDDVGWFNGEDDRENGGSARTAMTRRHCAKDYAAINELGERLNMRINCAFILGEWDPDDRLKKIKFLSKYGEAWNNSAYLGKEEMKAVVETVNASPYIDIAVHGLLHNYYKPGIAYSNSDYYYGIDDKIYMSPEEEIRARFDAFFGILGYYGINKTVNSFIPPAFRYIWDSIPHILADYGIKYVSTLFDSPLLALPEGFTLPANAGIEGENIITVNRNNNIIPWYEISTDPDTLPTTKGIFGCHWPNLLHVDQTRHGEIIEKWVKYFERCANTFGIILSRDIAFAATQSLFLEYSSVSYENGKMTVDISKVPKTEGRMDKFYISSSKEIKEHSGCAISLYEKRDGFINYEVIPAENILTFC